MRVAASAPCAEDRSHAVEEAFVDLFCLHVNFASSDAAGMV